MHDEGEVMARATTPAYRQAEFKPSLARHPENQSRRRTFCVEDGGRRCRTPKKIQPTNRPQKSRFKSVESDQFQIGTRKFCPYLI